MRGNRYGVNVRHGTPIDVVRVPEAPVVVAWRAVHAAVRRIELHRPTARIVAAAVTLSTAGLIVHTATDDGAGAAGATALIAVVGAIALIVLAFRFHAAWLLLGWAVFQVLSSAGSELIALPVMPGTAEASLGHHAAHLAFLMAHVPLVWFAWKLWVDEHHASSPV